MPKRWLSRNGRHNDRLIISSPKGPVLHDNQAFDFAFANLQPQEDHPKLSSLKALPHTSSDSARPITSSGHVDKGRKQVRIDAHLNRPKSSDGTLSPTTQLRATRNRSRSEEDFIGVAIGSPGQPPMAFCNENGERSPRHLEHAFGNQGPFPDQRIQPAKWKKLGNLFRTRPGLTKSRSGLLRDDTDRQHDIGPRHHWHRQQTQSDSPARVPPTVRIDRPQVEKLHVGSDPKTVLDLRPSPKADEDPRGSDFTQLKDKSSLPRLQTEQPGLRNMNFSGSSSSLLARRDKQLENLKSSTWLRVSTDDESEAGDPPRSARRQTTPTMSKPPSIAGVNATTDSPAASKYSLFPPAANNSTGRSPVRGRLERSNTSPARLSPMREQHSSSLPCPAQQRRGVAQSETTIGVEQISSPEEHTASTTQSSNQPWSVTHSKGSSKSSVPTLEMDEIFFDIKSIRDSRGVEKDDHFVMTRPDSVQVSLARTRSKLNGTSRGHQNGDNLRARIAARQKNQQVEEPLVKGKTPEEDQQLRCEQDMLREIETRVQQEINEKREKLIAKAAKGPQIPTPAVDTGRFSVDTAIFDEAIAAVEAMALPASMRKVDEPSSSSQKPQESEQTSPSKVKNDTQHGATHNGHRKQQSLTMKLLPPDPGMPSSRPAQESQARYPTRRAPTPEKVKEQTGGARLSVERPERTTSRTPSPLPMKPIAESSGTPSSIYSSNTASESLLSSQRRPVPASSHTSFMTSRAASPGDAVQLASKKSPLSATSMYSQQSPSSEISKSSIGSRLKLNDRPIEESPTIPQSPGPGKHNPNRSTLKEKPPPVPEKDSKFIPISKFAAQSTIDKVAKAGVRPTRVTRSVTDSALSSPLASSPDITGTRKAYPVGARRPVRSDTMPVSTSPMVSHASYRPSPTVSQSQIKSSPQISQTMTVVQAKPAAEVSVARTVSLARKQSARVMVPGPKLQARRQEEEERIRSQTNNGSTKSETSTPDLAQIQSSAHIGAQARTASPPAGLGLTMDSPSAFTTASSARPQQHHQKTSSNSSLERTKASGPGPLNSNPSTPDHATSETPAERLERERLQKAAIVEAAKARARARRRAESETRDLDKEREDAREREAGCKARIEKYRESQDREERSRWEIVENKGVALSPVVVEGGRGHRVGVSVAGIVVESA